MELHRTCLAFCIFAVVILSVDGFEFYWSGTPSLNRQLKCDVDANSSSQDIFAIIDLTIFDVTSNKTAKKLAAISVVDTDLYIDHASKSLLGVQGSVSRHYADLVVTFSNQTYCLICSYMCELNFINPDGFPVVRHSTVQSTPTGSDVSYGEVGADMANQIMVAVDRLDGVRHNIENRLTEMVVINEESRNRLKEMAAMKDGSQDWLKGMAAMKEDSNNWLKEMAVMKEESKNWLKDMAVVKEESTKSLNGMTAMKEELENWLSGMAAMKEESKTWLKEMAVMKEESKIALENFQQKLDSISGLFTPGVGENKNTNLIPRTDFGNVLCKKGMANVTIEPRILVTVLDNKTALCDTKTDEGGWIIFQRRTNEKEKFRRPWKDYKSGFGDLENGGNFWLGLQSIHEITYQGNFELRIDLKWKGNTYYAHYSDFFVGNEFSKYRLRIGGYSGNATNVIGNLNYGQFSTYDSDNDDSRSENCAESKQAGWWYNSIICYDNLNGVWHRSSDGDTGVYWKSSLIMSFVEMKIRLVPC